MYNVGMKLKRKKKRKNKKKTVTIIMIKNAIKVRKYYFTSFFIPSGHTDIFFVSVEHLDA